MARDCQRCRGLGWWSAHSSLLHMAGAVGKGELSQVHDCPVNVGSCSVVGAVALSRGLLACVKFAWVEGKQHHAVSASLHCEHELRFPMPAVTFAASLGKVARTACWCIHLCTSNDLHLFMCRGTQGECWQRSKVRRPMLACIGGSHQQPYLHSPRSRSTLPRT